MNIHLRYRCLLLVSFGLILILFELPRFGVSAFETGFAVTEYESRPHVKCSPSRILTLYEHERPLVVEKLIKRCAYVCIHATPATCSGFNIPTSKDYCEFTTSRCEESQNGNWHYYRKPKSRPESQRFRPIIVYPISDNATGFNETTGNQTRTDDSNGMATVTAVANVIDSSRSTSMSPITSTLQEETDVPSKPTGSEAAVARHINNNSAEIVLPQFFISIFTALIIASLWSWV